MLKPHWLTLRFRDPDLERKFRFDVANDTRARSRIGTAIAIGAWLLVGPWTVLVAPGQTDIVWRIAYAIGVPLCALGFGLTFLPIYGLLEWPRICLLVAQGLVFVAIQALRPSFPFEVSFAVVLLTVLYTYLVPTMRYLATASAGLTVSAACMVVIARLAEWRLVLHYGIFMFVANAFGVLAAYQADRFRRRDWMQKREIDRLLLDLLPEPIARRLQRGGVIADSIDEVTVLFADIVGFTPYSQSHSPAEVVTLLDRVFTAFDDLAERAGAEKVKTIGDAYMAVAGAPEPRPDHARVVVRLGREMLSVLSTLAPDLELRVGVHSGPVVAGVIGKRRYSYDLWGDTVNVASRMEAQGVAGAIQLTDATRVRLGGSFELEARGTIDVKGKGPTMTWLVRAPRLRAEDARA